MNALSASSLSLLPAIDLNSSSAAGHQNILFLLPAESTIAPNVYSSVIEMARYFARFAYVYVAREDQAEMADDEFGVRYMRLSPERLPSFGLLTKAFVFGDKELALSVTREHPTAEVFVMHPGLSVEALAGDPSTDKKGKATGSGIVSRR